MASTSGFEPGPHWWEASSRPDISPLQKYWNVQVDRNPFLLIKPLCLQALLKPLTKMYNPRGTKRQFTTFELMKRSVCFSGGSEVENYRSADIDRVSCKVENMSRFMACVAELDRNIRDRQWNVNEQAFSFFQEYVSVCGNQQLKKIRLILDKTRFRKTSEYKIPRYCSSY